MRHWKKTSRLVAPILAVIVALAFTWYGANRLAYADVQGQQGQINDRVEEVCQGLDVVFLIDQSESMVYNDRYRLRSSAVKTAIDIIGDNALYYCPGLQHRIAVLGFGSESPQSPATVVYIPPTVISPTLENLTAWKRMRDTELKPRIPEADSLGATDHLAAFRAAAEILQQWQQEPLGDAPRKRAVILVTDGGPCPYVTQLPDGRVRCDWREYQNRRGYLEAMEEFADPLGIYFPWRGADNPESVYLWLIAFNDATGTSGYLQDETLLSAWKRIARNHGGEVRILPRKTTRELANTELTSIVADILDPLLGSNLKKWDCREPIWIQPYLNNIAIIHVFRQGANPGVSLDDVEVSIRVQFGGEEIDRVVRGESMRKRIAVNDYTRDGPNERYVFNFPPPGQYIIEVRGADICRDVEVRIGERAIIASVLEPEKGATFSEVDEPPYYDEVSPSTFRVQLLAQTVEGKKVPLVEQPEAPLTLTVQVRGLGELQDKVNDVYILKRVDDEQAIYQSWDMERDAPKPIETRYPGTYEWILRGTTLDIRRFDPQNPVMEPVVVVTKTGTFRVAPVQRFRFEVVEPRDGDLILASDVQDGQPIPVPIQVTIQLVDEKGAPLTPQNVLAGEEETFELILIGPDGQILETKRLRPNLQKPVLSTRLRELSPGIPPDPKGTYKLQVVLLGNYQRAKFRPLLKEQTITFQRTDVQLFNFNVVKPAEGDLLPLIQGRAKEPLRVEVQVVDREGTPYEPEIFVQSPDTSPFEATLFDQEGRLLGERVLLQIDENANVFVGELAADSADPLRFEPGCYQIRVRLLSNYRSNVFKPTQEQVARQFCMQPVRQITWSIVEPMQDTYPLHPPLRWFPKVQPLPLQIQVAFADSSKEGGEERQGEDEDEGEQVPAATQFVRAADQPLFRGTLGAPDGRVYDVAFYPAEEAGRFEATWPETATLEGKYVLSVAIVPENLSPAFDSVTQRQERRFTRQDSLFTQPWSLLAFVILGLILLGEGWVLWQASGPLAGAFLSFYKGPQPVGSVSLSGLLRRRRYVVRKEALDEIVPEMDLQEIEATGHGDRFSLVIRWPSQDDEGIGEEWPISDVEPGEDILLPSRGSGRRLIMRVEKADERWWASPVVLLTLVGPLALWLGVIYLLNK